MQLSISKTVFLAVLFVLGPTVSANSLVDSWSLVVGINDPNQNPSGSGSVFSTPMNPFVNSHGASQPTGAMAAAAYNYIWTTLSADFQTDCTLTGTGYPNANASVQRVGCEDKIRVTPAYDMVLTLDASMSYAALPGDREAAGGWQVLRLPGNQTLGANSFWAQPAFGDPAVGTWTDHYTVTLLAGTQYQIGYGLELDSYPGSGTPSQLSHGSSSVHVHLDAVPEPVAVAPMAIAALLLGKRRSPRRRLS